MRPEMHVIPAVFFMQNIAVSRHEYRHRICQEKHSRRKSASESIGAGMADASIFQIDRVHQMMKGDVGVAAGEPRQHGSKESSERN